MNANALAMLELKRLFLSLEEGIRKKSLDRKQLAEKAELLKKTIF